MSIYIGLSKGNTLFSKAIMAITQAPVSHAFLLFDDPVFGQKMVLEAAAHGYALDSFERFKSSGNQVVALFQPAVSLDSGFKDMVPQLGDGYGYLGDVGMLEVIFGRKVGLRLRNPLASSRSLFCSQAVTLTMKLSSYPNCTLDPNSTAPGDLYDFLLQEKTQQVSF